MTTPPTSPAPPVITTLDSGRGPIKILSHTTEEQINGLVVDEGIGSLFRPSRAHEEFLRIARRDDGNVILAVAEPSLIVGYVLVERPVPVAWQRRVMNSRWSSAEAIYEMGAIEVSRNFRRLRLAEEMLRVMAADPLLQDKIVIASAMTRYWDLAETGLTARQYRDALIKLMRSAGFDTFPTSDRDIISDPNNALLAWFGPRVRPEDVAAFHELRMRL